MADRRTPQDEGTGRKEGKRNGTGNLASTSRRENAATVLEDKEVETEVGQRGEERNPNAKVQGEEDIRWSCKSGGKIKTAHTYRKGCDKHIPGATRQEMIQAARGRKAGRKRLLKKLGQPGTQLSSAEPRPDQVNKEKSTVKKRKKSTSSGTSLTVARGETARQKVGNKKRPKEPFQGSPAEEESNPDGVAVILGEAKEKTTTPRKQKPTATQPTEQTASTPLAKARAPPPESARVSEELLRQRTEENRQREQRLEWKKWEKAAKKYIKQGEQLQERRETKETEVKVECKMETRKEEKPPAENDQEANTQSQPLTPLIPRDESPIGDGSTMEELEGEEEDHGCGKVSESWHKNTGPAERLMPKKRNLQEKKSNSG